MPFTDPSSPFQDSQSEEPSWQQKSPQSSHGRLSGNNPFRPPATGSQPEHDVNSSHGHTSPELGSRSHVQSRSSPYHSPPLATTADDFFDARSASVGDVTPKTAYFPSGTPILPKGWNSPSSQHMHSPNSTFIGPNTSPHQFIRSPPSVSKGNSGSTRSDQPSIILNPPSSPPSGTQRSPVPEPAGTSRSLSVNDSSNRVTSFSAGDDVRFAIDETEEDFDHNDETFKRKKTVMKRHRWGTQRHAKGRPKDTPKRSKSIFARSHSRRHGSSHRHSNSHQLPTESTESLDAIPAGPHTVYFNMPLPEHMLDPESGSTIHKYPRNKIRTAKYTPLSFIPKNLFRQFQNVANIYFLFIVILGVSGLLHFKFSANFLGLSHFWCRFAWTCVSSYNCDCYYYGLQRCY